MLRHAVKRLSYTSRLRLLGGVQCPKGATTGNFRYYSQQGQQRKEDSQGDEKKSGTGSGEPVSFFNAFAASVRRQVQESKQMQQNLKQLSAETTRIAESDAVKRARDLAESGGEKTSNIANKVGEALHQISENPAVKSTVETVGKGIDAAEAAAEAATKPVLNTKIAKTLRHDLLDSSTDHRWIEYEPKEVRERKLAARRERETLVNPRAALEARKTEANPEAGVNVVMHRTSKLAQGWESFKESNPLMQRIFSVSRSLEETDSPLLDAVRNFRDRLSGIFAETETARVNKAFSLVEPGFRSDRWLKWATEYAIPEVIESLIRSDDKALKDWCSEATYSVLSANIANQLKQGFVSDCQLLDIRDVDLQAVRMLEDEIPVLVCTFKTQEVLLFRNTQGEPVLGKEDAIEHASYACVFTKTQAVDPLEHVNPRTNGWVVLELAKHGSSRGI